MWKDVGNEYGGAYDMGIKKINYMISIYIELF